MSNFEKSIKQIFDIDAKEIIAAVAPVTPSMEIVEVKDKTDTPANLDNDLSSAYEQTKINIEDLIAQGKEAMDEALKIAKASESPRAFEVFGGLLKSVVDANKELLSIQKQMREMESSLKNTATNNNTTIDKAIFVGSTTELNKFLDQSK